ncbi:MULTISPECIES: type IV secretion system protein [unclassified Variovorax]|uniref:type IV secretion system protein n=1 Tax=unclassified Variovorax TaxID=663243 RepID=UPI0008B022C6|nr:MULTISPECIES: type IV secretion system protein [unclassified Variovorax]SEK16556.1 type IV secretion system protein VirB6 [Variovorax sp. OK202]SFE52533.1 type IV secretion system protein VirB6 [Variovorax sp. OK212]
MSNEIIIDIYTNFENALSGFYEGAAAGISGYVIPVAWILLGICMLIWCYLVMEGKVAIPVSDWLLKFVGFMLVLHVMGNGYLSWVARPIFNLPSELTTAANHAVTDAPNLLGQVNEKIVNLISSMFGAASRLAHDFAIGPAIAVFVLAALVTVAAYMLLATALFAVIFSKLGLSLVLAVGPFFLLALVLAQTRNYFFSWVSTALYFVFYHVFTALFVFMFIGILNGYLTKLTTQLGGAGDGGIQNVASSLAGASGAGEGLNVVAVCVPIILISLAMFCMFLQIPSICASMTGGSGGSFFSGLGVIARAGSGLRRSR